MRLILVILIVLIIPTSVFAATARNFDGANDEGEGGFLDVTTGNVSLCVWVKLTENALGDWLIGKKADGAATSAGYGLRQDSADVTIMYISDGTDVANAAATTDIDGSWKAVCGLWPSSTEITEIWINSVQEDTTAGTNIDSLTTASEFSMGENGAEGDDATGLMAFGLHRHGILTPVEVAEYQFRPDIVSYDVGGLWPLQDGDSPEEDLSGVGRDLTMIGATAASDGPPVMMGGEPI